MSGVAESERGFQAAVLELAELCGWLCYHTHDSRRSHAGFPDLVLVRDGTVIVAELKTQRGRASRAQREWLEALGVVEERSGGALLARLWRPSDWPEIEALLTRRR